MNTGKFMLGGNYTQLCQEHARKLGATLGNATKGLCDICGSMNSFKVLAYKKNYQCYTCGCIFDSYQATTCPMCGYSNVRKL